MRPRVVQEAGTALPIVEFQHPVAPGIDEGGWMKPPVTEVREDKGTPVKTFSLEEVAKHDNKVRRSRGDRMSLNDENFSAGRCMDYTG